MIVGNYLPETSLAAIGASAAVYELLVGFALGVGNGFSIVTARCYGNGNIKQLKKSVAASLVIGIAVTILVMLLSFIFLYPLLQLLNTPENIIDEAYSYIIIISMFALVMFLYNLFAGFLRAIGNSFMPLIFLIISSVLNVLLDVFFIVKVNMGIQGAAIATVISQGISAVLCVIYIWRKCKILIPSREDFKFDKEMYKELLGQGLSMGTMLMVVSVGTVILQGSINNFGHLIIAGQVAARKISSFAYMPVISLALSLATFVSQNMGANQKERVRKSVKYANILAIIWGVLATLLLLVFSADLVKLLSGSDKSELLDYATKYLIINSSFYPILGVLFNLRNSLQGIGEKILPLFSSIIELIGKILFVLIFIPMMGEFGVIICEPIIWCLMCTQLAFAFYKNKQIFSQKN